MPSEILRVSIFISYLRKFYGARNLLFSKVTKKFSWTYTLEFWAENFSQYSPLKVEEHNVPSEFRSDAWFMRKNNKNRMYGFAFRFGSDDIDVGNLGSALDMNALSLTIYETRPSGKNMFMDSLIGISAINTNLLNNSGSISTNGKREGKQIFSSIKFRETFTKEKLN